MNLGWIGFFLKIQLKFIYSEMYRFYRFNEF